MLHWPRFQGKGYHTIYHTNVCVIKPLLALPNSPAKRPITQTITHALPATIFALTKKNEKNIFFYGAFIEIQRFPMVLLGACGNLTKPYGFTTIFELSERCCAGGVLRCKIMIRIFIQCLRIFSLLELPCSSPLLGTQTIISLTVLSHASA